MHRFFVPPTEVRPPRFALPEGESRHAAQVLRVRVGEPVQVLDGAGRKYACVVESVDRRQVWLQVEHEAFVPSATTGIEVFPAVAKGKAMELIIQKAVELGADRISPVVCEHSVAQYEADRAEDKAAKWQVIATEALKQCGREWLPKVSTPRTLEECLREKDAAVLDIVAALQPGTVSTRQCLEAYLQEHGSWPKTIRLWVGPEGDYSTAEYSALAAHGAKAVTLGNHVLRCETAMLALLAICQHELIARA